MSAEEVAINNFIPGRKLSKITYCIDIIPISEIHCINLLHMPSPYEEELIPNLPSPSNNISSI